MAERPAFAFRAQQATGLFFGHEQRQIGRDEHFARAKLLDGGPDFRGSELGRAKLARRNIHVRETRTAAVERHRGQIVIFVGA